LRSAIVSIGFVSLLLASCAATPTPADDGKLHVVASIYPLAYFAQQIAGSAATVTTLVPAGTEPHEYEPSPRDIAALENADIIILNGGSVDAPLQKAAAQVAAEKHKPVIFAMQNLVIDFKNMSGASAMQNTDPHVWLDPQFAIGIAHTIAASLSLADSAHGDAYAAAKLRLIISLQALDAAYAQGLASCPNDTAALTSHDAFEYLTKRYGIHLIPIAGLSPEDEPSPKRMAQLVDLSRAQHVTTVFFESLASPKLANTLADELGVSTDILSPIEGLSAEEKAAGKEYDGLMRDNLAKLRTALRCP
jgi:zinc transport system substrate-binding protein